MQEKVKGFFVSYTKQGNTLFMSTHLLETAEEICSDLRFSIWEICSTPEPWNPSEKVAVTCLISSSLW
jgi:hypothetical protein